MKKKKVLSVRISDLMREKLKEISDKNELSLSFCARLIIADFFGIRKIELKGDLHEGVQAEYKKLL